MSFNQFGGGGGGNLDEWSQKMLEMMDEMLKRDFVDFRKADAWRPAANVFERDDDYHVCIDLAGIEPDHVDVTCTTPTRLEIAGSRTQPKPAGTGELSVHILEIDEGRFGRAFELPEAVDVDRVEATYDKGYLWITLPKKRTP